MQYTVERQILREVDASHGEVYVEVLIGVGIKEVASDFILLEVIILYLTSSNKTTSKIQNTPSTLST